MNVYVCMYVCMFTSMNECGNSGNTENLVNTTFQNYVHMLADMYALYVCLCVCMQTEHISVYLCISVAIHV